METERERAEKHLLNLAVFFGSWGPGPLQPSQSREQIDAARWTRFEAATEALMAVGAVGEADVARYRRRLEDEVRRGQESPLPVTHEALASRARGLLERRLSEVAANASDQPAPVRFDDPQFDVVKRFELVRVACAGCGVLSEDELARWWSRLIEVDAGRTWWLERDRRQQQCTLTELLGVVAGSASRQAGVRVVTVELYADGVLVRWHSQVGWAEAQAVADASAAQGVYPPGPAGLSDDLGSEYLHVHTAQKMAGTDGPVVGKSTFIPAVPPAATRLDVAIGSRKLTVELPRAGASL